MRLGETFDGEPPDDLPEITEAARAELDESIQRPLATCSTEEIMEELKLRFPAFVFHGVARRTHDDSNFDYREYHGEYHAQVGLAYSLLRSLD